VQVCVAKHKKAYIALRSIVQNKYPSVVLCRADCCISRELYVLAEVLLYMQVRVYVHTRDREQLIVDSVHVCNASSTKTSTVRWSGAVRAHRAVRTKVMADSCHFHATAPVANTDHSFSVVYHVSCLTAAVCPCDVDVSITTNIPGIHPPDPDTQNSLPGSPG
jgi:hypothetical protein